MDSHCSQYFFCIRGPKTTSATTNIRVSVPKPGAQRLPMVPKYTPSIGLGRSMAEEEGTSASAADEEGEDDAAADKNHVLRGQGGRR